MINTFTHLKNTLSKGLPQEVIENAIKGNSWFSEDTIKSSITAICDTMLQEDELKKWISGYNFNNSYNVGVIMAGNIPLVGFYDMLAVLVSGSACYYKPSSKDKVLVDWVAKEIKNINPDTKLFKLEENAKLDAIIATGSDNSNRYFESRYGKLKSLYRGSRTSVAVLTKACSNTEIELLHRDIFTYCGLGCRNVSHLYLERDFDVENLLQCFKNVEFSNPKFVNNYKYQRAEKVINNETFLDGGYFTLQ